MGDIDQKARKRPKKDIRAMLPYCANVGSGGAVEEGYVAAGCTCRRFDRPKAWARKARYPKG